MDAIKAAAVMLVLAGPSAPPWAEAADPSGPEEATGMPSAACDPLPAVAQFLGLGPEQVQAFAQLLREREEVVQPLRREIAGREQRIAELLAAGGDVAEVGTLVIEIHRLRQLVHAAQESARSRFESLLREDQRRTWQHVRAAARLQPALPAFQALGLL